MLSRLTGVALALSFTTIVFASDPPASEADQFEVRFVRPMSVGQRYHVAYEAYQKSISTPTLGGQRQMPQQDKLHITMEGVAAIEAVDEHQQPTRITYTVESCEQTHNGRRRVVARPGSTLTAELQGEETVFTLDGRAMHGETVASLGLVLNITGPGASYDELCGTDEKQRIGDEWPLRTDAMLAELRRVSDVPVTEEQVAGSSSLGDVFDHEGQQCMMLDTEFTVRDWLSQLSPGFEIESAEFSATLRGLFPVDLERPVAATSEKILIKGVFSNAFASFEMDVVKRVEREHGPVPTETGVATAEEPRPE